MEIHDPPFDWVQFPEGCARFSGGLRGVDELGHETLAVEIGGHAFFGEIRRVWPDNHHFNLDVVSFGHHMRDNVGMPMSRTSPFISKFPVAELDRVQILVTKLVKVFVHREKRPFVMSMQDEGDFLGKVFFAEGWALAKEP